MSIEEVRRRSLADWIRELVETCDLDPLGGGERLRTIVGGRRARIGLDDEAVDVAMHGSRVVVTDPDWTTPVDGTGSTSTGVVLGLLDGGLEATDALHGGAIEVTGNRDSIIRIFHAIDVLLDVSARVPAMRALADDFRAQATAIAPLTAATPSTNGAEHALLDRLGLLGDRP